MIKINILSSRSGKPNIPAYIKDYFPVIGIVFVCVVMLNVFFILVGAGKALEVQRLKGQWSALEPQYRQLQALKTEVTGLRQKVTVYRENAFPLVQFSKVMEQVYLTLPDNLWLTDLQFDDKALVLKGGALDVEEQDASMGVNAYKDALAASGLNELFSGGVEIVDLERSRIKDRSILRFELRLKRQQVS